jgi:hypothetical protein
MVLTEEQGTKMYDISMANGTHIEWSRKNLTDNDAVMKDRDERLRAVEGNQAFMRGKMTRFVGGVAAVIAIGVNAVLWAVNHFKGEW